MKILIVQDCLRSGGTERQSILLANAFAAAGHAVTLLTFRPGGALASTVAGGVQRIVLQPLDTRLDWFAPRLLPTAARLAPDVVLCMGRMANCYAGSLQHHLSVRSLPGAAIATMRTGKPLPWLFRRSLRLVRHIVANSHDARNALVVQHRIAPDKISVIHNSLVFANDTRNGSTTSFSRKSASLDRPDRGSSGRPDRPSPEVAVGTTAAPEPASAFSRESLRSRYGASDATIVLLCVAMFRPEKNQRELIEIAADFPPALDWQLWLAGDGPARAACEQLARAKNLASRIKFPGFVRDPSALYAAADIAVHASTSESLSNFLIEAQAHGLPAVACEAQGIRESFVPDRTGWAIARGDRSGFRAAIERLARTTPDKRATRAAEARTFARATFDPARQVEAYLALFDRLNRGSA